MINNVINLFAVVTDDVGEMLLMSFIVTLFVVFYLFIHGIINQNRDEEDNF